MEITPLVPADSVEPEDTSRHAWYAAQQGFSLKRENKDAKSTE